MNDSPNHNEIAPIDVTGPSADEAIGAKIKHILNIYPVISPSMLQMGVGSGLPPAIWKPVYSRMIANGEIKEDHIVRLSSTGRQQSYTLIYLATTKFKITQ